MNAALDFRPVTASQLDAAERLYGRLTSWQTIDSSLRLLAEQIQGFGKEACLLKAVAVNSLYATRIFAIVRMGEHLHRTLKDTDPSAAGIDLVPQLAALPDADGQVRRRHVSFASKFAHFFVDSERYPILDSFAVRTLKGHCLRRAGRAALGSYPGFVEGVHVLLQVSGVTDARLLDRYLWLAGQCKQWREAPHKSLNSELRTVLEQQPGSEEIRALVQQLVGANHAS
jgi:hypothetical protein